MKRLFGGGRLPHFLLLAIFLSACGTYKQNIMFAVGDQTKIMQQAAAAEKNYVIQKNDLLILEVYTNKGERIIDPDLQLTKGNGGQTYTNMRPSPTYFVDINGVVKFPMIGDLKVEGLSLREAEEILQKEYQIYYQGAFVILKFNNKRAIVLGSPGGQVIPLANGNMRLTEVLALAKGINNDAKAHNIRVLRKDQVFVADLSTFEAYVKNDLIIEPGDIVYVEPVRRPVIEGVRDFGPIISIITSLVTLVVIVTQ